MIMLLKFDLRNSIGTIFFMKLIVILELDNLKFILLILIILNNLMNLTQTSDNDPHFHPRNIYSILELPCMNC